MTAFPHVTGVVVTYNPDLTLLEATLRRLSGVLAETVVVDNSDDPEAADRVARLCRSGSVTHLPSGGNVGIASAQNRAARHAIDAGAEYVLFLDDDSELTADAVRRLVDRAVGLRSGNSDALAFGPRVVDRRTRESLTYVWRGRHLVQLPAERDHTDPTVAAFLLGSGALVAAEAFTRVGWFRDDYFIDHVDKEWGLRAGAVGITCLVFPDIELDHSLGDVPERRPRTSAAFYTHRSAVRDYYLTRNACLMFRDLDLPVIQFVGMLRLLVESSVRKTVRPRHPGQRAAVVRGLWHGIIGIRGPMP
ncbi:glycosyltransferase family 2 protein [Rhodococcus kroppenstedtii]|uniref:glycosyltransferase family 2 protein n=1 Tax=Rhodococcoides kroppenstedtii TaxID=293050 RepID=UPI001C9ACD70|nr:glycosyltransferase family 2 protein [Rhodococcus kroppenstedtii]MBY6437548.1 glycosyltransferase family 2 protein [Rhodococcus kroppenstedtii]